MSPEELCTRLEREITERLKLARRAADSAAETWSYEDGEYHPTVRVGPDDETWRREVQFVIWTCEDEADGCPELVRGLRAEGRHIAANDPAHVIRACERDLRVLRRHSPEPNPSSFEDKPRCAGCTHEPIHSPWPCWNDWPCDEITDMAGVYLPAEGSETP